MSLVQDSAKSTLEKVSPSGFTVNRKDVGVSRILAYHIRSCGDRPVWESLAKCEEKIKKIYIRGTMKKYTL